MNVQQPDPRIPPEGLGTFSVDGSEYVSHSEPGCPWSATIEFFRTYLRCSSCYRALTQEAAVHVLEHSDLTKQGSFIRRR
jgi:hypothetical protein